MTKPQTVMNRVGLTELPESMQAGWHQAMDLTGDATFIEVNGNKQNVYNWNLKDFYQKLFYSDRIETTLVELVRLRLANVHGCAFCNKGDTAHALKSGITQAQIDALNDYQNGPFSAREKLALELSDEMVLNNQSGHIDKDLYGRAKNEFTDGEINELRMLKAVLFGVTKITIVFDLVENEDYCKF